MSYSFVFAGSVSRAAPVCELAPDEVAEPERMSVAGSASHLCHTDREQASARASSRCRSSIRFD